MSYFEYKNSGRIYGKLLYQLNHIGVPQHIVESVIFGNGVIFYQTLPFATYVWVANDVPVFTFLGEYKRYNAVTTQEHLNKLFVSEDQGKSYKVVGRFITKEELDELLSKLPNVRMYIENGISELLDINLNKILKPITPIDVMAEKLRSKFSSR